MDRVKLARIDTGRCVGPAVSAGHERRLFHGGDQVGFLDDGGFSRKAIYADIVRGRVTLHGKARTLTAKSDGAKETK